jgi:hypothetical protein
LSGNRPLTYEIENRAVTKNNDRYAALSADFRVHIYTAATVNVESRRITSSDLPNGSLARSLRTAAVTYFETR